MAIGGTPAPNQTISIVPAGTYTNQTKTWPQRNVPDAIRAWRISLDIASRPVTVGCRAYIELSWDNGATWEPTWFALSPGDANPNSNVLFAAGGLGGLASGGGIRPAQNGVTRIARGQAEIWNGSLTTTGMTLELWV
jgi:hypothetical protein